MHSSISIEVRAPARRVFELARDVADWPRLLPHYRKVTIQSRSDGRVVAQMAATRHVGPIPLPVTWRAEQWPDDADPADLQLHFRHVGGVTRGMVVAWHIRPADGEQCEVTIEHDFRRRLPLLGDEFLPAVVNRFFIRPIAGRTLATFKLLAESEG